MTGIVCTHGIGRHDTGQVLDSSARVQSATDKIGARGFVQAAVTTNTIRLDTVIAVVFALDYQCVVDSAYIGFVDIDRVVARVETDKVGNVNGATKELDTV